MRWDGEPENETDNFLLHCSEKPELKDALSKLVVLLDEVIGAVQGTVLSKFFLPIINPNDLLRKDIVEH